MYLLWFNLCFCKCELQKNVMQSNVCNVKYSNPLAVYCFPYQFMYFVTTRFWQVPSYITDVFNNLKKVFESSACICSSLFEQWTMLIVFLFLVLTLSIRLTIKPYNLRKFNSWISEKHDQTTIFTEGVLNNQSCSSVHLPVFLSIRYILFVSFLNSFHEGIWPYVLKSDKAKFWKTLSR